MTNQHRLLQAHDQMVAFDHALNTAFADKTVAFGEHYVSFAYLIYCSVYIL